MAKKTNDDLSSVDPLYGVTPEPPTAETLPAEDKPLEFPRYVHKFEDDKMVESVEVQNQEQYDAVKAQGGDWR